MNIGILIFTLLLLVLLILKPVFALINKREAKKKAHQKEERPQQTCRQILELDEAIADWLWKLELPGLEAQKHR